MPWTIDQTSPQVTMQRQKQPPSSQFLYVHAHAHVHAHVHVCGHVDRYGPGQLEHGLIRLLSTEQLLRLL